MNILLRVLIIAALAFAIWEFSGVFRLDMEILTTGDARWFNILFALSESVVAPALALAAIVLAAANKRLVYVIVAGLFAIFCYVLPHATFFVGIMIYGF